MMALVGLIILAFSPLMFAVSPDSTGKFTTAFMAFIGASLLIFGALA